MQVHTVRQKSGELDKDFEYRQQIENTLNLMRAHFSLVNEPNYKSSITHIKDATFRLTTEVSFPMPTDDGGTYWETEVASLVNYTWYNYVDALKWVLSQHADPVQ